MPHLPGKIGLTEDGIGNDNINNSKNINNVEKIFYVKKNIDITLRRYFKRYFEFYPYLGWKVAS